MALTWKDIATTIGKDAPVLSSVLAATGVGAPAAAAVAAAGALISGTFGVSNTPDDVQQALITNPDAAVKLRQLEDEHGEKLKELANAEEARELDAQAKQVAVVNETMQTEDKTRPFSWRDYWGYIAGTAFGFVVLAVIYLVVSAVYLNKPELMTSISPIIAAFTTLFTIAATVLGVQSSIETHHAGMVDRITAGQGGQGS